MDRHQPQPELRSLPIYDIETEIREKLRAEPRLIIRAPTGSGKSTQVPQMLLEQGLLGDGQVVILQPRRLAARLLANRVAMERGVPLGREVGYQIRFDNVAGPQTRIKFVTEGVLLRQMLSEPDLKGIQALIFDEFHERHLYGDITLARALDIQNRTRPDLLILVMSATLKTERLEQYLRPCHLLGSEGRVFPIDLEFSPHSTRNDPTPVWERAADEFTQQVQSGYAVDTLIFMPGSYEIHQTIEEIRRRSESRGFLVLPLHGELSVHDQDAAVSRYPQPKVIVSTNVAETSLTIDGVRLVIDSGLARIPRYDPHRGINTLFVEKISRASADQRTGRAGRTAPGRCVRLWSEREHEERPVQELPEIKRLDLSEVVLTIKASGAGDLSRFRWLEPPEPASLEHAQELLIDLGALDSQTQITETGRRMLSFPVHPRYARMLLAAQRYGCVFHAALIAALTQGRDLLLRNPGDEAEHFRETLVPERAVTDFALLMAAWEYAAKNEFRIEACRKAGIHGLTAKQVGPLLNHFIRIAEREGLEVRSGTVAGEALQKCILTGFSDRVARRLDQGSLRCEMVHGRRGVLARESRVHHSPLLVSSEVREIQSRDGSLNTILSLATAIDPAWLDELFPGEVQTETQIAFDSAARRVCAEAQVRFRGLIIGMRRIEPPPREAAAKVLAKEILEGRLALKEWDHGIDQWILRLNLLSRWCPELGLPPIEDQDRHHLLEQICLGAFSYREIKDREVKPIIQSWLSESQRTDLEQHAPERLNLSNGRKPRVSYVSDGPPTIALRIQELYDVTALPRIAMNRTAVLIQILAPNMRPVQITQDLGGFWKEHYPKLKQELQRKYPKHEWR